MPQFNPPQPSEFIGNKKIDYFVRLDRNSELVTAITTHEVEHLDALCDAFQTASSGGHKGH